MADWCRTVVMLVVAAFAAAAGVFSAPASGAVESIQSSEVTSSSLGEYARELNDERFDVREAATKRLIEDEQIQSDDIMEFVCAQWETLAPEAVERFLLVARERYIASPGAIGIEFAKSQIATIDRVIAGTPADRVLQRGDQLMSLNGEDLPESYADQRPELLKRMARFKAGDVVRMHLRRGVQELDVEFALADPRLLPRFEDFIRSMQYEMLQQWNALCARRLPPQPRMMIDMNVAGVSGVDSNPRSSATEEADASVIEEFSRRRAEVSQGIARVIEQLSTSDSPDRLRELNEEYASLRDESARLNARLRLLESRAAGKRVQ